MAVLPPKESHFIRVELVSALGKLEWIKRITSHCASETAEADPLFRIREVRSESIDKARTFLKPECFVPQVRVEQSRHRLINARELKDENVSRLFSGSPEDRHQHIAFAPSHCSIIGAPRSMIPVQKLSSAFLSPDMSRS